MTTTSCPAVGRVSQRFPKSRCTTTSTAASARHETPYGTASISWRLGGGELLVDLVVPTGADAIVELPGQEPFAIESGSHSFTTAILETA